MKLPIEEIRSRRANTMSGHVSCSHTLVSHSFAPKPIVKPYLVHRIGKWACLIAYTTANIRIFLQAMPVNRKSIWQVNSQMAKPTRQQCPVILHSPARWVEAKTTDASAGTQGTFPKVSSTHATARNVFRNILGHTKNLQQEHNPCTLLNLNQLEYLKQTSFTS